MIRVRRPDGTVLEYNGAYYVVHESYGTMLYEDDARKRLFAIVQDSAGAIIEWVRPCRIVDGTADDVARVAGEPARLRELDWNTLRALKTALRAFHMQRGWR
jgi:hypothetical protein